MVNNKTIMEYKLISILKRDNNSVEKEDFYHSKLTFSGNFAIIESEMGDYSALNVFDLKNITKIRTYNKKEV